MGNAADMSPAGFVAPGVPMPDLSSSAAFPATLQAAVGPIGVLQQVLIN